jgi:NADPH-dependent curcumin reductase CurA
MSTMFHRRIRLEGFVVADTPEYNARFFSEIPPLIAEGKIKAQEQLFAGLESGPEAFLSMFDGTSVAKPVVVVDSKYGGV